MKSPRELQLEKALSQFIRPIKNIPFELIIQSLFGAAVEKFDPSDHKVILSKIAEAMKQACKNIKADPIRRPRPNEVGNDIEAFVLSALKAENLKASPPKTKRGRGKSTGYPDIKIETKVLPIYLEVKTHSKDQFETSLRSFFLSPSLDPKVVEDAFHLLVCFEMLKRGSQFEPTAFKIVDLYGLDCDMKSEFNSDNRRLYQKNRLLAQGDDLMFNLKPPQEKIPKKRDLFNAREP